MFAVYQMAFDDAALAMVVAKFHYNYWRPITAIRNGAADGNDARPSPIRPGCLLPTPFPEYPCGHCTVSGAIAEVMTAKPALARAAAFGSARSRRRCRPCRCCRAGMPGRTK